jgi:hypothetical protein
MILPELELVIASEEAGQCLHELVTHIESQLQCNRTEATWVAMSIIRSLPQHLTPGILQKVLDEVKSVTWDSLAES